MTSKSVFVEQITADWLRKELPAVAKAIADDATGALGAASKAALEQAVAAAREEGVTAERARITGIEAAAFPGQGELVAKLKADPKMTVEGAKDALIADQKAKGKAHLTVVKSDESKLDPPTPGAGGDDPSPAEAAKNAVALAERSGVLAKRP